MQDYASTFGKAQRATRRGPVGVDDQREASRVDRVRKVEQLLLRCMTGTQLASLLSRCKTQHGPQPTDDTINSWVTAWHNAVTDACRPFAVCHAPEVPPEPWPKPAWRYRLLRLVGR